MQPTWQNIIEITREYRMGRIQYWLNEVLFSVEWWILFVTGIVLVTIWLIILDKKRAVEIVTYGLMVAIVANLGDTLGLSFLLWGYPRSLVHLPEIIEIHEILMPIIYMMLYQYFRGWKTFIIAAAINSIVFAFILEPLLVWLQIYESYHWKHIYSVIPYFVITIGLKWIIHKLKKLDRNYEGI